MISSNRNQNRWLLVVLVCAVQLAVALALVSWGMNVFREKSLSLLHEQMLDQAFDTRLDMGERSGRETAPSESFADPQADPDAIPEVESAPVPSVANSTTFVAGQPVSAKTGGAGEYMRWHSTASRIAFTVTLLVGFLAMFLNMSILQKFDDEITAVHRQLTDTILKRTRELGDTQKGVIFGLAKLAESRDNDTGDHLERIRRYVTVLAEELRGEYPEIDDQFIENLSVASSLHDIGKVGIPDAVLLKSGHLTDLERKIMEFHTIIGGECLWAIQRRLGHDDFLRMAHDIAIAHHERWDGSGYPHQISGESIPLSARILMVADVYDALTSKRPYKSPMSHVSSSEMIQKGAGTQFDPRIVDAFLRRSEEFRLLMEQGRAVDDDTVIPAIARLQEILGDAPEVAVY